MYTWPHGEEVSCIALDHLSSWAWCWSPNLRCFSDSHTNYSEAIHLPKTRRFPLVFLGNTGSLPLSWLENPPAALSVLWGWKAWCVFPVSFSFKLSNKFLVRQCFTKCQMRLASPCPKQQSRYSLTCDSVPLFYLSWTKREWHRQWERVYAPVYEFSCPVPAVVSAVPGKAKS